MADAENTSTDAMSAEAETPVTDAAVTPEPAADAEPLGDAGKRALSAERDARKAAEKRIAELEAAAKAVTPEAPAPEVAQPDTEALKAEMRAEFANQLAETSLKAEAKGRLRDPADALLYVDVAALHGADESAYTDAIDKLIKNKPYLAAEDWVDVGTGPRTASKPEPSSALDRMASAYESKSKR
ncbi:hypothetical protein [Streptomyces sp. NBC_01180]|uniref:hypothetical protein n=1 Tax=Streptomyces sp. NBC_01180 TaxID=2903763 RepID=UPI00386551D9|nr:hypothetical protein OG708_09090 [Streptomyces sp. NBC_01180]